MKSGFLLILLILSPSMFSQTDLEIYNLKGKVKSIEVIQIDRKYQHLKDTSIYKYSDTSVVQFIEFDLDGNLKGKDPGSVLDFIYVIDLNNEGYDYEFNSEIGILSMKKENKVTGELDHHYYRYNRSNQIIVDSSYTKTKVKLEDEGSGYGIIQGPTTISYGYNDQGYVEYYFMKDSFGFALVDQWTFNYEYDSQGNWTQRNTYPLSSSQNPIGTPNQPIYVFTKNTIRKIEYYE